MKNKMFKTFAAAAMSALLLCGCFDNTPKLYVYTWADYIDPELVSKFEKDNGCEVVIDTFDSNETMYAKLLAGAAGYDIIMPTEYVMPQLINADLVDKLDIVKMPNVATNFDSMFTSEWSLKYNVPYAFSCTGVLYRKDKFPEDKQFLDWNDMFAAPETKGRVCMMNDIREVLGIALIVCGYSANSTNEVELSEAAKLAIRWKRCSIKMDNECYRSGIPSGEFYVAMSYNSDAIQLLVDNAEAIGYSVPTNGTTSSIDVFCIMKNSKSKDLAYKFIDMFYELDNAVSNAEYNGVPMPVRGLYDALSDEYKAIPFMKVTDELKSKCEDIKDVGDNLDKYSKAWDKVLSTK